MNNKGNAIFCSICVVITFIILGTMFVSYYYYASKDSSILGDGATIAMYADNNEVSAMPSGYTIDSSQSFCFKTDRNTHDTGAVLTTGGSGEPVIGNLVNNEKCVLYFGPSLAKWLIDSAPKSGTSNVGNSPWILTSDRTGEWRYAGKNPDNYIQFNGELWRIIGVMPNMTYCTGTYGSATECDTTKTGSLVKIIRNQIVSSTALRWDYKDKGVGSWTAQPTNAYGSNDWSDSQLMLMLNGTNYLKTGYDVNNTKLHTSYTIASNVVKDANGYSFYNATYSYLAGSGTTVYVPSQATTSSYTATSGTVYKKIESSALSKIATVKWDLYGTNSYTSAAEGSPAAYYNKERNISNTGKIYDDTSLVEKRAAYWYGKIGLMYPSDYGYATYGGTTYDRTACLGYQMNGWSSGNYKTDCAANSYLLYDNITSAAPGTSGKNKWTITQLSSTPGSLFYVRSGGNTGNYVANNSSVYVDPVLYLKIDTLYGGSGTGKWNDPYTIS